MHLLLSNPDWPAVSHLTPVPCRVLRLCLLGLSVARSAPTRVPLPSPTPSPTLVPTPTPTVDAEALSALYVSLNGASWTAKANWMTAGLPCNSWYGVTCNSQNYVSSVSLTDNGLSGSLPTDIGRMTQLANVLALGENDVTGQVPTEVGRLSLLTAGIELTSNKLSSSTLPTELGLLTGWDTALDYQSIRVVRICWPTKSVSVAMHTPTSRSFLRLKCCRSLAYPRRTRATDLNTADRARNAEPPDWYKNESKHAGECEEGCVECGTHSILSLDRG